MKIIIIMLPLFLLTQKSFADKCRFKSEEQIFKESNYIFLAEVKSNMPASVSLSVTKIYKGDAGKVKMMVAYPGMERNFRGLKKLKVGIIYFFSSTGDLDSNTGKLTIKNCDQYFLPNPIKNRFSWLDKVNLPDITKNSNKK